MGNFLESIFLFYSNNLSYYNFLGKYKIVGEYIPGSALRGMIRYLINERSKGFNNEESSSCLNYEDIMNEYIEKFLRKPLKDMYIVYELKERLKKLFE